MVVTLKNNYFFKCTNYESLDAIIAITADRIYATNTTFDSAQISIGMVLSSNSGFIEDTFFYELSGSERKLF